MIVSVISLTTSLLAEVSPDKPKPSFVPSAFYEVSRVKAITNNRILPQTWPIPGAVTRELTITACRGEYEPASFVVHAKSPIKALMLIATGLKSDHAVIPAQALDIRAVKCWFQAGVKLKEVGKRLLTPELLLKDDKLIAVDLKGQQNYIRTNVIKGQEHYVLISGPDSEQIKDITPWDAELLMPVDIEAGTNKQFWVTVHVPEDAAPGHYQGKIKLSATNAPPAEIEVRLRVLPFTLEKPALTYSIFYHGKLTHYTAAGLAIMRKGETAALGADWKSPQQYLAEMRDLKAHGVDYPTSYQPDLQVLPEELQIREKVGLPEDFFYTLGAYIGNPTTPDNLLDLKRRVKQWKGVLKKWGYGDIYFWGMDEARGEKLKSQRSAWQAVRQAGGKMFASVDRPGAFEMVGELLDTMIRKGPPIPREVAQCHSVGHQIFCYANDVWGGDEMPETWRRNFGLVLWKAGYDGSMIYAYQNQSGYIWNDFDNSTARDGVFAYPTLDGVIDTLQWEGFREGVDDVRYATTLRQAIARAKESKPHVAEAAQAWMDKMDPQGDLDQQRQGMIDWILKLQ